MNEVLVAIFATEDAAVHAISALTGAGIPRSSIRRYRRDDYEAPTGMAGSGTTATGAAAETRPHQSSGGFWSWLLGEEGGTADYPAGYETDYRSYHHSIESGRVVLAVTVAQTDVQRVHDLLDAQSPISVEDSGPTTAGGEIPTSTTSTPVAPASAQPARTEATTTGSTTQASGTTTRDTTGRATTGRTEEVIPLAEEQVDIGKRQVQSGTTTNIRRYVTERPVERQVTLKDEHVEIERRKPTTQTDPGSDAFQERTIEARDVREEPVVEKTAKVGEEVVVRKETREHPETVRATERKEKVDVKRGNKT